MSTSSRSAEALDRIESLLASHSSSVVNGGNDDEEKRLLREEIKALKDEVDELKRTNATITKNFKDEIYRLKSEVESIKASAVEAVSGLNKVNDTTSKEGNMRNSNMGNNNISVGDANNEKHTYFNDDVSEIGIDMGSASSSPTRSVKPPQPPPMMMTAGRTSKIKPTSHKVVLDFEAGDKLSQVVEERLLFTVYDKYKAEASGLMPLSRLIRFAKEFGIIAGGNCEQIHPMLVAGDLDVLYKASLLVKTNESAKSKASSYHQHFLAVKRNIKATNYAANQSMTVAQFIQVIREVANKLYANILEQQTCTSMDYLTPSQKAVASKAAMELLIQHKIFPTADRMGLIPWPLLNLDKTLSVSYEGSITHRVLGLMAEPIETWFLLYLPQNIAKNNETLHAPKSPPPTSWMLSYKGLSRFAHDLDIVPGLFNEPQLYSLFEEIVRWSISDPRLLWESLPHELTSLEVAQYEIQLRNTNIAQVPDNLKNSIGVLSFSLLLATTATMFFQEDKIEHRLERFFEWIQDSNPE